LTITRQTQYERPFPGHRQPWMEQAECAKDKYEDKNMWYPKMGAQADYAIAVCNRCPVQFLCLTFSVQNEEWYGVWGGMPEEKRRQLIRAQRMRRRWAELDKGSGTAVGGC
jgi:WhiB family redox-sensing transcriptional regulator